MTSIESQAGELQQMLKGVSGRHQTPPAPRPSDGTTERQQGGTTGRSKFTVLLDQKDAVLFDALALEMRSRSGRRVEKAEILRALLRLADTNTRVNAALADVLDRRPKQSP
ncbi:hypothetical protein [Streptomyces tubercidicus]|uniref:hypothetical protein n=1 Tax=Streptomyces tubercidicus TaxID=47759 RepID=UPI0036A88E02